MIWLILVGVGIAWVALVAVLFIYAKGIVWGYSRALTHIDQRMRQASERASGRGAMANLIYVLDAIRSIQPDAESIRRGQIGIWEPSAKLLGKVRALSESSPS